MLIRIVGNAKVSVYGGSGDARTDICRRLHGIESSESFAEHLPSRLADLGLVGGTIKLSYDIASDRFEVSTEFRCPNALSQDELDRVSRCTVGQWSDGLGAGCFDEIGRDVGARIELLPFLERDNIVVTQIDDGKATSKPKYDLYHAARNGELDKVRRLLDAGDDIEGAYEGSTPLNTAVLAGHRSVALVLIERGANIQAVDKRGSDILMATALSNRISDEDAAVIARAILERGVLPNGKRGSYTPLFMARNRKKTHLEAVLLEFGATS